MATLRHDVPTLMDGWLFKEGRSFLRSRTRRFLRLKGTVLSNHHSPGSPASWEASVISCPVTAGAREHELVVALPNRQLSFFAETATDFAAWVDALRTASARSLEDYYLVGEVLGQGSFAKVHRGVDRETGEEVAIKIVSKAGYTAKELEYVVREVAIMRELNHPNVVTTYDIFETVTHLHLVIELCEGGELFDIVADNGHLSEQNASHVMRSIVSGIEYLHSQGICHRDIKVRCGGRGAGPSGRPCAARARGGGLACLSASKRASWGQGEPCVLVQACHVPCANGRSVTWQAAC